MRRVISRQYGFFFKKSFQLSVTGDVRITKNLFYRKINH